MEGGTDLRWDEHAAGGLSFCSPRDVEAADAVLKESSLIFVSFFSNCLLQMFGLSLASYGVELIDFPPPNKAKALTPPHRRPPS